MKPQEIVYNASKTLSKFHKSDKFVRAIVSCIGSGKSVACVMEMFVRACQQQPGPDGKRRTRFVVVRNTYGELRDTAVRTFFAWIPETLGHWHQSSMTFVMEKDDIVFEVLFRALDRPDDAKKLLSLELTGAWLNEAKEIPKPIFDAVCGRVGRYPPMRDGGPTWTGVILDSNPCSDDEWMYKTFEEDCPTDFVMFHQPGGLDPLAENLDNLPPGYYTRQMQGKSDAYLRVYRDGLYGFVQDGLPIFPNFNEKAHVILERDVVVDKDKTLYIGFDWGLTPAASFAQKINGHWIVIDEIVTTDMGASKFADLVKTKLNTDFAGMEYEAWGDPSGDIRAQTDEATPFLVLKGKGILARPTVTNDPLIRHDAVTRTLTTLAMDGVPVFRLSTKCKILRKALGGRYRLKKMAVLGSDQYQEKPVKDIYSHVSESLEYLMLGAGEGNEVLGKSKNHKYEQIDYPKLAIA